MTRIDNTEEYARVPSASDIVYFSPLVELLSSSAMLESLKNWNNIRRCKKMSQPKNITESLTPLLFLYAFIGHGVFLFPADRPRTTFSIIYAIISVSIYTIALAFCLNFMLTMTWYDAREQVLVSLLIYVNVVIAVFTSILSWRNVKRYVRIIKDVTKVDETLRELGATFDYCRAQNEGYAFVFSWIITVASLNWVSSIRFQRLMSSYQAYSVVSILLLPLYVNTAIAFQFSFSVRLIGIRYREATRILEHVVDSARPIKINKLQISRNEIGSIFTLPSFWAREISKTTQNHGRLIQIIKHVHLQLGQVGRDVNKAFGQQLAFEITATLVMFTGLLYELYTVAFNPLAADRYLRMSVTILWLTTYLVKLIFVNDVCERVCEEARRIGRILHSINENNEDPEIFDDLIQFSLQLMCQRLVFSPGELIALGHEFIRRFMATVTTYLVILIQMAPDGAA